MNNEIIIKQNGFVTGDALLNPVAYAGEMNSRILKFTHPTFDNCCYQMIVIKNDYPYTIGISNGEAILPPSLITTPTVLKCQFIAVRKNENIDINANLCDCKFSSSDDCTKLVWKSDMFKLSIAQGLSLNGLNPVPPYEQLVDIYNNISKAKLSVEKVKVENSQLLETINQKIDELQRLSTGKDDDTDKPSQPNQPGSGDNNQDDEEDEIPLVTF